jgi:hypothetical protein
MWKHIRRTPSYFPEGRKLSLLLAVALTLPGCFIYTFQAGSGFPSHVRTLAVIPFENDTPRFELSQEMHELLLAELPRAFGLRTAGEEFADAVVRGRVRRYSVETPSYRPSEAGDRSEVVERQVVLALEVQVVDLIENVVLWESTSLVGRGEFLEASGNEDAGRQLALTRAVQSIIDGMQSNW